MAMAFYCFVLKSETILKFKSPFLLILFKCQGDAINRVFINFTSIIFILIMIIIFSFFGINSVKEKRQLQST